MEELVLLIDYDGINDTFCFNGNVKKERIPDLINDFLYLQIGKGEDKRKAEDHDLYTITIYLDLSDDTFSSGSNCGNYGLRDGILMRAVQKLNKKEIKNYVD